MTLLAFSSREDNAAIATDCRFADVLRVIRETTCFVRAPQLGRSQIWRLDDCLAKMQYSTGMTMAAQNSRWQFSLRELVALTVLVILAVGFWQERIGRQQVTRRLEQLIQTPLVWTWSPGPLDRYDVHSSIVVAGEVFVPADIDPLPNAEIEVELLRADDLAKSIAISPAKVSINPSHSYSFVATFKQSGQSSLGLMPGTHLVRVKCSDKNSVLATGVTAFEVVDGGRAPE